MRRENNREKFWEKIRKIFFDERLEIEHQGFGTEGDQQDNLTTAEYVHLSSIPGYMIRDEEENLK